MEVRHERGRVAEQDEQDEADIPEVSVGIDEATELLKSRRRRRALEVLNDIGPTDLRTVADELAVEEFGENYNSTQRKRVYVALYQAHVPKLRDYCVIEEQEQDRNSLRPGPEFEVVLSYLDALRSVECEDDDGEGPTWKTLKELL